MFFKKKGEDRSFLAVPLSHRIVELMGVERSS